VKGRIDVARLHHALDGERQARALSWRELARLVGVSPSLLTRMGQGYRPDLESFAALVQWLDQPAETFMIRPKLEANSKHAQPALEAELTPLLRARRDLTDDDKQYLEQVVTAAITFIRAKRNATG
jgi:transcriptional regulator with XRE-family HTH domain